MAAAKRDITIRYSTLDRFHETRRFKSLKGARAYARGRMGEAFDIGSTYAVDEWGTGKIEATGATLDELLAADATPPPAAAPAAFAETSDGF